MARGSSKTSETPDFYIQNPNMRLKREIINIAANKGISVTAFLRSEIIRIRDSYPSEMLIRKD